MTDASVVRAHDLTVRYGDILALDGVDLTVEPGQVLGVLGANGAGKSTLLRAIGGIVPPVDGSLVVDGNDLTSPHEADLARAVTGYCPDVGGLIRQCTVREHVALLLSFSGSRRDWPAAIELARSFGLAEVFDRTTEGFSHGMSRRVSVMLAVLAARKVLILDEPFDGVDPLGVTATMVAIESAAAAGKAVLISTHLRELLVRACTDIVVVVAGRVVDSGPAEQFAGDRGDDRYAALLSPVGAEVPA